MLNWMREQICDPTDGHYTSRWAPYAVEAEGREWLAATNGFVMLTIHKPEGVEVSAFLELRGPVLRSSVVATTVRLIEQADAPGWATVGLDAFREWIGSYVAPITEKCSYCDGKGETECECLSCGDGHMAPCHVCDDGKKVTYPEPRPAWIGDVRVNRNMIALAIERAPGHEIQVSSYPKPNDMRVYLRGNGWRAVVMGLRPDEINPPVEPHWLLTPGLSPATEAAEAMERR